MAVPKKKNSWYYQKGLFLKKKAYNLFFKYYNIVECIYCKKNKENINKEDIDKENIDKEKETKNFLKSDYISKAIFNKHKICLDCLKKIEKKKEKKKKETDDKQA